MRNLGIAVLGVAAIACGPAKRSGSGDDNQDVDANTTQVDAPDNPPGDGTQQVMTFVYAHTSSALYKVDPDTLQVTLIGNFTFTGLSDQITDIAIDKAGVMIGISFTSVYRIDPSNAKCTLLTGGLSGTFNGLSFVPAAQLGQTGADVLVATRNSDGTVFRVDQTNGNTTPVGNMGGTWASSGDLVSVAGFGTVQTTDNGASPDRLVNLATSSFAATQVGTGTIGFNDIWGVAYWKGKIFGFTEAGEFITIDPNTGVGTLVQGNGPHWWGAAVTTLAPVIF